MTREDYKGIYKGWALAGYLAGVLLQAIAAIGAKCNGELFFFDSACNALSDIAASHDLSGDNLGTALSAWLPCDASLETDIWIMGTSQYGAH